MGDLALGKRSRYRWSVLVRMPKKEKPSKKSAKPPASAKKTKKPKEPKEPVAPAAAAAPAGKVQEEAPPVEEMAKEKEKTKRDRLRLSVLQAAVLETIRERPQRPRAIQTIIRGAGGVDIPRNEVIRSLNELKEKGLVEKTTAKAWRAK
jgi:3-oxoacyl-ACP reductase-like protein